MKIFKYRALNHIVFWIFIYAFYSLPEVISSGSYANAKINLTFIPFDILTVYAIIGYFIPRFLFKRKFLLFVIGSLLAIAVNVAISEYIKHVILPLMGYWIKPRQLSIDLFYALLTNFMIVGMATAMKLLSHSFKMQLSQSETERRSIQSELKTLRSQVNPHFLFNVLNNIDSLIYENKEKASNAIFLLSRIMRFMLQESSEENVLLEKELTYIKDYVELAKLSFRDPSFVSFYITGDTKDKRVSPLLFIPVIENAVKYCNKQSASPGISIRFTVDDRHVTLETSNFVKKDSVNFESNNSGIGLKNLRKRLSILYKDRYRLDVKKDKNTFNVYLKIPLL